MQEWTSDALWNKAKTFGERAFTAERNGDLFPLFASLSLEMLGKAVLAKVHPVLIADPREGKDLLYAFGYPTTENPKSIAAKTVFNRLVVIVPDFTTDDERACLLMADRRNAELHTGEFAFREFPNGKWLPDFYRVTKVLVEHLGFELEDYLGHQEAKAARQIIQNVEAKLKKEVNDRISKAKRSLEPLRGEELERRKADNEPPSDHVYSLQGLIAIARACPACGSKGRLFVNAIGSTPARLHDGEIMVQRIYAPTRFECKVCDLSLSGTGELSITDLADQIAIDVAVDPAEMFDLQPDVYVPEDDYGND